MLVGDDARGEDYSRTPVSIVISCGIDRTVVVRARREVIAVSMREGRTGVRRCVPFLVV